MTLECPLKQLNKLSSWVSKSKPNQMLITIQLHLVQTCYQGCTVHLFSQSQGKGCFVYATTTVTGNSHLTPWSIKMTLWEISWMVSMSSGNHFVYSDISMGVNPLSSSKAMLKLPIAGCHSTISGKSNRSFHLKVFVAWIAQLALAAGVLKSYLWSLWDKSHGSLSRYFLFLIWKITLTTFFLLNEPTKYSLTCLTNPCTQLSKLAYSSSGMSSESHMTKTNKN